MEDPVIPYKWGTTTSEILQEFTTKSQFTGYEGLLHCVNEKVRKISEKNLQ